MPKTVDRALSGSLGAFQVSFKLCGEAREGGLLGLRGSWDQPWKVLIADDSEEALS